MDTDQPILSAIELLGGPVAAAAALKVPHYQSLQNWVRRKRVPPTYCIPIERLLDGQVRCEQLNPDLDWTYLRGTSPCPNHQA